MANFKLPLKPAPYPARHANAGYRVMMSGAKMCSLTLLLMVIGFATGCMRADESDCDRAYEKWIDLKTKGEPEVLRKIKANQLDKQRPRFLSECVGKTSKSVIECWLNAKDQSQLERCE